MQGVYFEADVFMVELSNYDMVLSVRVWWLSILSDIVRIMNVFHLIRLRIVAKKE